MSDIINNAFANIDPYNKKFVEKNTDIVEEIFRIMEENGINSQKELAQLLNKKESEISKVLSGLHNMTLRSITSLEVALGTDIILTNSKAKEKYNVVTYFVCDKQPLQNDKFQETKESTDFSCDRPTYFELKIA